MSSHPLKENRGPAVVVVACRLKAAEAAAEAAQGEVEQLRVAQKVAQKGAQKEAERLRVALAAAQTDIEALVGKYSDSQTSAAAGRAAAEAVASQHQAEVVALRRQLDAQAAERRGASAMYMYATVGSAL